MRPLLTLSALFAPCLALAACGSPADTGEAAPAEPAAATAPSPTPTVAADGLAAYVGKYPSDEVAGVSWNAHPVVRAAVQQTVTDAAVRGTILDTAGTTAPIQLVDGKVAAWACEPHNCGAHQWSVLVDPATGAADVCYFDEAARPGASRWFLAGGTEESRPGNCQLPDA